MSVPPRLRPSSIEALEARIAPALLVTGANLLGGRDNPSTGETSIGGTAVTLVKVLSGQAIVWFDGMDITGISFGPNTRLDITGDVDGDIVGNLTSEGLLSDSDSSAANGEDGGVLLDNKLLGLTTRSFGSQKGDIGNIITGGSITNVTIEGTARGVFAGNGVYRPESAIGGMGTVAVSVGSLDVNPVLPGVQSGFSLGSGSAVFTGGASISNVEIGLGASLQVFAGDGDPDGAGSTSAPGVPGGSVSGVQLGGAFPSGGANSYTIIAGKGGNGSSGGAGGSIRNVIEVNSFAQAALTAGDGGNGLSGKGGLGGSILSIDLQGSGTSYTVTAGDGGNGAPGGAGGNVLKANFAGATLTRSLIVAGDFTGDGNDDVVVMDAGTGKFTVLQNSGAGSSFDVVPQGTGNVELADAFTNTSTPIDIAVADMDGDLDLDLIVAYANTDNLGIYFNDGSGDFYGASLTPTGTTVALLATPVRIAVGNFAGSAANDVVVFSGETSTSFDVYVGATGGTFTLRPGTTELDRTLTDLVVADNAAGADQIFLGFSNGELASVVPTGMGDLTGLDIEFASIGVANGVAALDIDAGNDHLIALNFGNGNQSVFAFDIAPDFTLTQTGSSPLQYSRPGSALDVRYVDDTNLSNVDRDDVVVLTAANGGVGSEFQRYLVGSALDPDGLPITTYTLSISVETSDTLGKMTSVNGAAGATQGFVAIGSTLETFASVDANLGDITTDSLPFAPKNINVTAGNGGNGLNFGNRVGNGGVGGRISGINLDSTSANLTGGDGGDSASGTAGAGGSVGNSASFVTASGTTVAPRLRITSSLTVETGDGGSSLAAGSKKANGGTGGALAKLVIDFTATTEAPGSVTLTTGSGGSSVTGTGGGGGAMSNVSLTVKGTADGNADGTVTVAMTTGDGGAGAKGGAGGTFRAMHTESIHIANEDGTADLTRMVLSMVAGDGGTGTGGDGGAGGSIILGGGNVIGGVTFSDLDSLAPAIPLTLAAGNGGGGSVRGGGGGDLTRVVAQNSQIQSGSSTILFSGTHLLGAIITAGDGGTGGTSDGGRGGGIASTQIGADAFVFAFGGAAGAGGTLGGSAAAKAKGGAGGSVTKSFFGVVDAPDPLTVGLHVESGAGGAGVAAGGVGGLIGSVQINALSRSTGRSAELVGGAGGEASGSSGKGGDGGDIIGIRQSKDLNSSLDLILAGNGGNAPTGTGGDGGDVRDVRVAGYIGKPSDRTPVLPASLMGQPISFVDEKLGAFQLIRVDADNDVMTPATIATYNVQGLFSGRGGIGGTAGDNGAVADVKARGIAAIAAAPSATTGDSTPPILFASASSVSNVTAGFIGYDADGDGAFDSTGVPGPGNSPAVSQPIDGFILAQALVKVTGNLAAFTNPV